MSKLTLIREFIFRHFILTNYFGAGFHSRWGYPVESNVVSDVRVKINVSAAMANMAQLVTL